MCCRSICKPFHICCPTLECIQLRVVVSPEHSGMTTAWLRKSVDCFQSAEWFRPFRLHDCEDGTAGDPPKIGYLEFGESASVG